MRFPLFFLFLFFTLCLDGGTAKEKWEIRGELDFAGSVSTKEGKKKVRIEIRLDRKERRVKM